MPKSKEVHLEDFEWIFSKNTLISNATRRLSKKKKLFYKEQLKECDIKNPLGIYSSMFEEIGYSRLEFSRQIFKEFLPVLAIIPEAGAALVYECNKEGVFKAQTRNGRITFETFPANTLFAPLRQISQEQNNHTAYHMFKKVALEQKGLLAYAAIATISINILALGTSLYTMQVYDRVVPTGAISTLIALTIGVFIAIFLEMLIKFSRATLQDYSMKKMDIEYSNNIFSRFLQIRSDALPKSIGTLSSQLQSYSSVRGFITSASMFALIDLPFSFMFVGVIYLLGGIQMAIIPIVFLVISILFGFIFRGKIEQASQNSSMSSYKKMGVMVETVENSESIKATGAGYDILNKWNALTHSAIDDDITIKRYSDITSMVSTFFQQISYVCIVAFGAYLVAEEGAITMGALIAMTILSGRILQPIAQLPNHFVQWGRAKLSVKDLNTIYSLPSDNDGINRPLFPEFMSKTLKCSDVKFSYIENAVALNVASLEIREGEKVAILGSIGSGKSTLLKILSGLYKPSGGFCYLDGIDMQLISREKITETIAYLPQKTTLFAGTLRDNLVFGLMEISDDKIIEAAKLTGLIHIINALPKGLDTIVPEGGESISGGQKQLVALTRVLVANAPILLMDEPTASIDEGTEKKIINMLRENLSPAQTMVVVTHKPSVLSMVDRIVILTSQGIVMDGPRDEILKRLNPAKKNIEGKNNES